MWLYQKKISPDAESDDEVNKSCKEITTVVTNESTTDDKDADDVSASGESNSRQPQVKEQKEEDLPPVNWAWKGYLTWYLHGCMAPKSKRLAIFDADDKPKTVVKLHAKRRIQDSLNAAEERKEKRGLHALSTSNKINIATLSVQRI